MNSIDAIKIDGDLSPSLTPPPEYTPNWMGRIVEWIRDSQRRGPIHNIGVYAAAVILSLAMVLSIVLCPLFIYGYTHFVKQRVHEAYSQHHAKILIEATESNRAFFLKGRLDPIPQVQLSQTTRERIIQDLGMTLNEGQDTPDHSLLQSIAVKTPNYVTEYGLTLIDPS